MYINFLPRNGLMLGGTDFGIHRHAQTGSKIEILPRSSRKVERNLVWAAHNAIVIDGSANTGLDDLPLPDTGPITTVDDPGLTTTTATLTFNPADASSVTTETLNTINTWLSDPIPTSDSTSDSAVYVTTTPIVPPPPPMSPTQVPSSSVQANRGSGSQSASATASAGADNSGSNQHPVSKPLSGGAIAGIFIATLLLALAAGALAFRKRVIMKRNKKRRTWQPKPFVVTTMTTTTVVTDELANGTGAVGAGTNMPQPAVQRMIPRVKPPPLLSMPRSGSPNIDSTTLEPTNASAGRRPSSLLSSMLNEASARHDFDSLNSSPDRVGVSTVPSEMTTTTTTTTKTTTKTETKTKTTKTTGMAQRCSSPPVTYGGTLVNAAMVRCVFVPKRPDELRVRVGESMRVLTEYDDGWAFCENVRGERGMIPLECVDRSIRRGSVYGGADAWVDESVLGVVGRQSMRKSSLPAPKV